MTPTIREIDNRSPDQRSGRERYLEERVKVLQAEVVRQEHVLRQFAGDERGWQTMKVKAWAVVGIKRRSLVNVCGRAEICSSEAMAKMALIPELEKIVPVLITELKAKKGGRK